LESVVQGGSEVQHRDAVARRFFVAPQRLFVVVELLAAHARLLVCFERYGPRRSGSVAL
jgi:hypothetical protein